MAAAMTWKTGLVVVVAVGACAGPRSPVEGALSHAVVEAVYTCGRGPIVIMRDRDGAFLLDGSQRELVTGSWRSGGADHFVVLTRIESRAIALEYLVPRNRSLPATMLTYDKASGAAFKIIAAGDAWRIHGDSRSTSSCETDTVTARR
jgi:hypothetical protein